jgi:hypothetical protein
MPAVNAESPASDHFLSISGAYERRLAHSLSQRSRTDQVTSEKKKKKKKRGREKTLGNRGRKLTTLFFLLMVRKTAKHAPLQPN